MELINGILLSISVILVLIGILFRSKLKSLQYYRPEYAAIAFYGAIFIFCWTLSTLIPSIVNASNSLSYFCFKRPLISNIGNYTAGMPLNQNDTLNSYFTLVAIQITHFFPPSP